MSYIIHLSQKLQRKCAELPQYAWLGLFLLAAATALIGQLIPDGLVRALFTLPPTLLLPGYAIVVLLFGRARPNDPVVVSVLSIVLSLAVLIADGLILNLLGVRFSDRSLGLSDLLVLCGVMGLLFITGRAATPLFPNLVPVAAPTTRRSIGLRSLAFIASVILGLGCVAGIALSLPTPKPVAFTALSLSGRWASDGSAPIVNTGHTVIIPLVATTQATPRRSYQVIASVNGVRATDLSITLSPRRKWDGSVSIVVPLGHVLDRVEISLQSGISSRVLNQLVVYLDNHAS